jgi:transposase
MEVMCMLRKACGVDVHQDGFVAIILSSMGCETRRFVKDLKGIEAFKSWLKVNKCRAVVMESTGVYWIPLYAGWEGEFDVKLAMPREPVRFQAAKLTSLTVNGLPIFLGAA